MASPHGRLLKECGRLKTLIEGKQAFVGGLGSNIFASNALIKIYSRCGNLVHARKVFDEMPQHDDFSWATIVWAYTKCEWRTEALDLFEEMQREGVRPKEGMLVSILRGVCTSPSELGQGKRVHASINRQGFELNISVSNALIEMYSRCGGIEYARRVFDKMHLRDVGGLEKKALDEVSWTAMIAGYARHRHGKEALELFRKMLQQEGVKPKESTFVSLLKACATLEDLAEGKRIHVSIKEGGFESSLVVANALIDMYVKCGSIEDAWHIFHGMQIRDVVTWTAIISGCDGHADKALALFRKMHWEPFRPNEITYVTVLKVCSSAADLRGKEIHAHILDDGFKPSVSIGNALIDMYGKCGKIEDACRVFYLMLPKDVVSWNVIITTHVQHGRSKKALALLKQMQHNDVKPDEVTFVSLLKASSSLSALEHGKWVHVSIVESSFGSNIFVGNALVDMYAKCGSVKDARRVFDGMCHRTVVSWNAIIGGYAQHGYGKEALSLFKRMLQEEGPKPDEATFISLLLACSHEGLVDQAHLLFDTVNRDCSIKLRIEHYACMVDLLGRTGRLVEAEDLIKKMPIRPDAIIWRALLSACRKHGTVDLDK